MSHSRMHLATDQRLPFDSDVASVWNAMAKVDAYQQWWPWLRTFEADALAVGEIWKCVIVAPLRYTVSFTLKFDVVVPDMPGYDTSTTDAWERPLDYSFDSSGVVTLRSLGADKRPGGDGDNRDMTGLFDTRDPQRSGCPVTACYLYFLSGPFA